MYTFVVNMYIFMVPQVSIILYTSISKTLHETHNAKRQRTKTNYKNKTKLHHKKQQQQDQHHQQDHHQDHEQQQHPNGAHEKNALLQQASVAAESGANHRRRRCSN